MTWAMVQCLVACQKSAGQDRLTKCPKIVLYIIFWHQVFFCSVHLLTCSSEANVQSSTLRVTHILVALRKKATQQLWLLFFWGNCSEYRALRHCLTSDYLKKINSHMWWYLRLSECNGCSASLHSNKFHSGQDTKEQRSRMTNEWSSCAWFSSVQSIRCLVHSSVALLWWTWSAIQAQAEVHYIEKDNAPALVAMFCTFGFASSQHIAFSHNQGQKSNLLVGKDNLPTWIPTSVRTEFSRVPSYSNPVAEHAGTTAWNMKAATPHRQGLTCAMLLNIYSWQDWRQCMLIG